MEVFLALNYNTQGLDSLVKKILHSIKGVKEVYFTELDNANIAAFADWNEAEIPHKIAEIRNKIPEMQVRQTEILTPV